MKKNMIRFVALFGFVFALSAANALAQNKPILKADIPFDFSVTNRTLPAGEYTLMELSGFGGGVIAVTNGKTAVVTQTMRAASNKLADKPLLVFRRYGDQYFLARVIYNNLTGSMGHELIKTRAEKKAARGGSNRHLARSDAQPELITIVAEQQ